MYCIILNYIVLQAHVDFVRAVRRLGKYEARAVWSSVRQGGAGPLAFRDLLRGTGSPEAENLDAFAQALQSAVGFELERAWRILDANRQHRLTYPEFREGALRLLVTKLQRFDL